MASRSHAKKLSALSRKQRARRKLISEQLERRELLAAEIGMPVWAPGTSETQMNAFFDSLVGNTSANGAPAFGPATGLTDPVLQGNRWTNPVGGASPNQGDPAIVTWSIVPDGTTTLDLNASSGPASDLISFLDGIYGGAGTPTVANKPWFSLVQQAYDRWSEISGVFFTHEPSDDGAALGSGNRGVDGVRGDVRVSGAPIDGNFGILAFNFYPNGGGNSGADGDMVVDTSDIFFANSADGPTGPNLGLVNTLTHESGHGIGLAHTMPTDATKLMEPFINLNFQGPQLDERVLANQLYGDRYEATEGTDGFIDLGVLPNGTRGVFDLSIDRSANADLFRFEVNGPRILGAIANPIGGQYLVGSQGGPTPTPIDTLRYSNLKLRVLADDQTTEIANVDTGIIGAAEVLSDVFLPTAGTYFVEVSGAENQTQLYEFQLLLQGFDVVNPTENAPRLISVNPNAGEIFNLEQNNLLLSAPNELTFRFDGGQRLDPDTLQGIRITRSGGDGTFNDGNEQIIDPGYLGFGESERIVIARFAESLVDDQYKIEIFGFDSPSAGIVGLRNLDGQLFRPENINADRQEIFFEVEIGALVTAVVPQPIDTVAGVRTQHRDQIHVYFNSDPLSEPSAGPVTTGDAGAPTVVDPKFYQLFFTAGTVENTDDQVLRPSTVTYDPAINRAVLTFPSDLSEWAPVANTMGAGTLRLRVGSSESLPAPPVSLALPASETGSGSPGDTFGGARSLGSMFGAAGKSIVIDSFIQPINEYLLQWPGAGDEPGIREIRRNSQLLSRADTDPGIATLYYNFDQQYGDDAQGNRLSNAITPAQKQRLREVLDLYEQFLGVRFVESKDRGLQIVTGDMRAIEVTAEIGAGDNLSIYRNDDSDPSTGLLILDGGENWYDGYGQSTDAVNRPSWFLETLRQVGSLLGIGDLFDRPPGTAAGSEAELAFNLLTEPDFLSQSDITLGQYLFRPEGRDVDLYRFDIAESGHLTAETFAERLGDSSLLDTNLTLWKRTGSGTGDYELVARNDDFYSNDSFVGIDLNAGTYVIGVSASGNDTYDPSVPESGLGGRSQGRYQLRLVYQAARINTIVDTAGTQLDGDADGVAGGDYNFWFRTARPIDTAAPTSQPRLLFVDKAGVDAANRGGLTNPLRTIDEAMRQARSGDIIRILPSAGADRRFDTLGDNAAYEIGRGGVGNAELTDGANLEVKQGVTVMIDAGTILKLRSARISVGSTAIDTDRSQSALQVLGTPIIIDASGVPLPGVTGGTVSGRVLFTSYDDQAVGIDTNPLQTQPAAGQWGGLSFRNDVDYAQGRPVQEREGIFLSYVGYGDIRYGGGVVGSQVVTPVEMNQARPAIKYTIFRNSSDAALSADPNSFEETNFHSPLFQRAALFTSDYDRVGPDLVGNRFINNSINGLFVRIDTPTVGELEPMSVSGRFDDADITYVLSQQLILQGTPGGPLLEEQRPAVLSITSAVISPGAGEPSSTLQAGNFDYRLTFVDIDGNETVASLPTNQVSVAPGQQVRLAAIPTAPTGYVGRRLYRRDVTTGQYVFVTQLNRSQASYIDRGVTRGGVLDISKTELFRARYDARLSIDPGVVVKVQTARIEATFGADFYAEGLDGRDIVFTSRQDDRYGAGGNFDTNNDGPAGAGGAAPQRGDWGGLIFRQSSSASLDHILVTYAGGNVPIEGDFASFNPVEILQAKVRIANSILEKNEGQADSDLLRGGRGFNDAATVFVRGAQPVIINSAFRDNQGAAISINPDSLNYYNVTDWGRGTAQIDRMSEREDNQGPLIRNNRLSGNDINGLKIRSEVLTTESVWDDTDIVHVVAGDVIAVDHHYVGGLRLEANPNESLVVKFDRGARLLATGRPLDIDDRIGGTVQVVGQPGFPVILTSLKDDSVGAGFTPDGRSQTDTNGGPGLPAPGDWQGIVFDVFANDRNVATVLENEPALATAAAKNAVPGSAQFIGALAEEEKAGDENERLGFTIQGTLSTDEDLDVYSFMAQGGTEVWLDIDRTAYALDSVVELIDQNGNILALSDDSFTEQSNSDSIYRDSDMAASTVHSLNKAGTGQSESPNPKDAGFRVVLPGAAGQDAVYYVRVRSSNLRAGDASDRLTDQTLVRDGLTHGAYRLGIRLREMDEVAGSTVQFADIRYAVNGVQLVSAPLHSPLAGEAAEQLTIENGAAVDRNNLPLFAPLINADRLGNLMNTDRAALSVTGRIGNQSVQLNPTSRPEEDIDMFRFELRYDSMETEIFRPDNRFVPVTFDVDYADGLGRVNTSLAVYDASGRLILVGRDSNVAGDVGTPLRGVDMTNLGAGSAGVLDAHIGPVELPEGIYYVAVHSDELMPVAFDQFTDPNSPNKLTRVLPVNSIRPIASDNLDDHIAGSSGSFNAQQLDFTADRPVLEPAFGADTFVPYTLSDLSLFVAMDGGINGGSERTTMTIFDPFTGRFERTIGETGPRIGDLAIRGDGELYSYSTGPQSGGANNGNIGNYLNISSQNGVVLSSSDDGILFRRNNQNGDGTENDDNAQLIVEAMAFDRTDTSTDGNDRVYVVGYRDNDGRGGEVIWNRNLMYSNVATTGATTNRGSTTAPDRDFGSGPYREPFGPASQKFELGVIDTGLYGGAGLGGDITGLAIDPNNSGNFYAVDDRGGVYLVRPFRPTKTYDLSPDSPPPPGILGEYASVLDTTYLGRIAPNVRHAVGAPAFSGVSFGPLTTEGSAYRRTLFATTEDGWLYGIKINTSGGVQTAVPAPVFSAGHAAVQLAYIDGTPLRQTPVGLAFSTLEQNPWHQTVDRRADAGHGVYAPYDQSRQRSTNLGGDSLYFGFEISGDPAENTLEVAESQARTLAPGGSHGSVVTQPFSLVNYSSADKPTAYFSYFLETEGVDYFPGRDRMRDSFRVFAAGDDGQWQLLATNDSFREFVLSDEYDYFTLTDIPVQELHDNTNAWRQARADISPLAGNSQVRLRFDFATAGGMSFGTPVPTPSGSAPYMTQIQMVPGDQLRDGDVIRFRSYDTDTVERLEVDLGYVIEVPSGDEIRLGDSFRVTYPGNVQTMTFTAGAAGTGRVPIRPNMTSAEVAQAIVDALPGGVGAIRFGTASVGLTNATALVNNATGSGVAVIGQRGVSSGNTSLVVEGNMTRDQVALRFQEALVVAVGQAGATPSNFKSYAERVTIHGTVLSRGPFGVSGFLPGDEFGNFENSAFDYTKVNPNPGRNNEVEGLYLDDLVIGFAERGEMVLNAPANDQTFIYNPQSYPAAEQPEQPNEILTGAYNLELRTSAEFGVPEDYDPINLYLDEDLSLGRSFDTNDRLDSAVTIVAQGGGEIRDGDTFVLSDGTRSLTFEFDSVVTPGIQQGRVPVSFDPRSDLPTDIAAAVRDAVNSQQVQLVLDIRAESSDSRETGRTTSNLVELFGDYVFVNPTVGRNLKIDLVKQENFQDRVAAKTIPEIDVPGTPVRYVLEPDQLARAYPTAYLNGQTDSLVAVGKIGDRAMLDTIGALTGDFPEFDTDALKIHLFAGDTIDIDLDAVTTARGSSRLIDPALFVYDADGSFVTWSGFNQDVAPGESVGEAFIRLTAPRDGYYYVEVRSRFFASFGEYQLNIRPATDRNDVLYADYHLDQGDLNRVRDQGQILISSNFISDSLNWGISATPSSRNRTDIATGAGTLLPKPGTGRLLRNENSARLLPGAVISNNVVIAGGRGGITFEGDASTSGQMPASVPFGRIVNNTVVGAPASGDVGINVGVNASPTVMNNIMAGFDTGLRVDASPASQTTIVAGNIYRDNNAASNYPLGNSSYNLDLPSIPNKQLFTDAGNRIYIPANGSLSIDSSFASLSDRQAFYDTVKQPVGVSISPIISPSIDAYGQPRVDDPLVQTPAGVGANVFIDRGALDRADFIGPLAWIAVPSDFITGQGAMTVGGDTDGTATFLQLASGTLEFFEIQLLEPMGSGPNSATVVSEAVVLTENGKRMQQGIDYNIGYSAANNTIRLTPLSGIWRPDAAYEITLNNRDRLVIQAPSGDGVIDGEQIVVTDANGNQAVLEYETGYVLEIPQTLTLVIPAGEGGSTGFRDGDQFLLRGPDGTTERFELNVFGDVGSGVVEVPIAAGATAREIRDAILQALVSRASALDLAPVAIGENEIQIGSLTGHFIDTLGSPLAVIGVNEGIIDGDVLTYRSGTDRFQVEFNLEGNTIVDPASNAVITFSREDTYRDLADKLASAFRDSDLPLSDPRSLGDGRVHLGGAEGDILDTDNSVIRQTGSPGVTGSLLLQITKDANAFSEGDQFLIRSGGISTVYEFTFDRDVQAGAVPIRLTAGDSADAIATRIIDAITTSNIGLTPTKEPDATIRLNETIAYQLDLMGFATDPTTSPLVVSGVSGGAIAIPVIPSPSLSPDGVAAQIVAALRQTSLISTVFTPGGGSIWFFNTEAIEGPDVTAVGAIRDLAGNRLQPNRTNEETQFTILMPNVRLDFGDAPDSYGTLLGSNGARSTLGGRGLPRLGALIDSEPNGQPGTSDNAGDLVVNVGGGSGAIGSVAPANLQVNGYQIPIAAPTAADDGAQLVLQTAGRIFVFELDVDGLLGDPSFISVSITEGMTAEQLTVKLAAAVNATTTLVAAIPQGTTLLVYGGDEDGVPVGQFQADSSTAPVGGLFFDVDGSFLSFLNPLDATTDLVVTTTGGGLLDAWIDFNADGDFEDAGERILDNRPVLDGVSRIQVTTPSDAVEGLTWARFRLSRTGNQQATGVIISGEVEDYQVRIARVAPPVVNGDEYDIDEDGALTVSGSATNVLANDDIASLNPASVDVQLERDVQFGTLTLDANGDFRYTPDPNFYGADVFTYRLFGVAELIPGNPAAGVLPIRSSMLGTVTITVNPVNDVPVAVDKAGTVAEDAATPLRFTAAQLLAGAGPADLTTPTQAPWDESDQTVRITAIGDGTTSVTAPTGVGLESVDLTTKQGITVTANFSDGALVDVLYQPSNNYNFNNPLAPANPLPSLDTFTFTVSDDGRTVYLDGNEITLPDATRTATVTVTVDPVNDAPEMDFIQLHTVAEDAGPIDVVTATNLLPGPANARDESGQVVTFTLTPDPGNRTGLFVVDPTIDSNGVLHFETAPNQAGTVIYTVVARDNGPNDPSIGDDPEADPVTLTIAIAPVNDAPEFTGTPVLDVLEDKGPFAVQYASGIRPGPIDAVDEGQQNLQFTVVADANNPAGLINGLPTINGAGMLRFTSSADAVGSAVFYVTLRDDGGRAAAGDVDTSAPQTVTINVRPVNDTPRVIATQPAVYTLLEDNPLLIPLRSAGPGSPPGLLDQFSVGPANELANGPGGNQTLSVIDFGTRRMVHGTVETIKDSSGAVTALRYVPDDNYNSGTGGGIADQLFYSVTDDGVTFDIAAGTEVPDPLAAEYRLDLVIEPVNDEPTFNAPTTSVRRLEDAGKVTVAGFATNIAAGPPTAGDETDPINGQSVSFLVQPAAGFSNADLSRLFAVPPAVSSNGTLTFTAAPDAVGTVVVLVTAMDSGANDPVGGPLRGDDRFSRPATLTVTLDPVNDAPVASPTVVSYELDEDRSINIPLTNTSGTGLYDIFRVGPANEGPGTTPGGNQTFATNATLFPQGTAGGGTLTPYFVGGNLAGLRYTPATDFNGPDAFVFGVQDNGQSYNVQTGALVNDFRETYATVSLMINPVNDRPQFAGGVDVTVSEDAGSDDAGVPADQVGRSGIANWATNILPGPPTANDENEGESRQTVKFELTYLSGASPSELFTEMPTVDPLTGQLRFRTAPDANGSATFQVVADDDGPTGFLGGDSSRPENLDKSLPRQFTITVTPVNDAPVFTPGADVTVSEDNGPYNLLWATGISAGPADEVAAGQAVLFDVDVEPADRAKFATLPTVSDQGILRFTPADNAFGVVVVSVTARDTAGAVAEMVPLTITISPINDRPVAVDDRADTSEDSVLTLAAGTLLQNDLDVDLPADQLAIGEADSSSLLGAEVTLSADGTSLVYDPRNAPQVQALRPGQTATDLFTYRVKDASGALSEPATVTITVSGSNDAPVARVDNLAVRQTGPSTLAPLANDTDVDGTIAANTVVVTLQPAFGSLTVSPNGTMTYTPFDTFQGTDLIRYVVRDDLGAVSNQAEIRISANDAPIAENDSFVTYRNEALTFAPLSNDHDANGTIDPTTLEILSSPAHGTAVVNSDGTISYQPDTDYSGNDSLTYRVRDDGGADSNTATVSLRVIASRLQNPTDALDVNNSGQVSPIDALLIINHLNRGGSVDIEPLLPGPPYLDVDGNQRVTPVDALRIINRLNRVGGTGEGEENVGVQAVPGGFVIGITADSAAGMTSGDAGSDVGSGVPEVVNPKLSAADPQWDWADDEDRDGLDEVIDRLVESNPQEDSGAGSLDEVWTEFGRD